MANLEKAILIAVKHHKNQRDSEGAPKVLHPINVMFAMDTENEMIAAILHDVIEDTEYTLKELSLNGFSKRVLYAVDCLTHRPGESYHRYMERVKSNDISAKVKLADLENNMDVRRMDNISQELMTSFIKKYKPLWNSLSQVRHSNEAINKAKITDISNEINTDINKASGYDTNASLEKTYIEKISVAADSLEESLISQRKSLLDLLIIKLYKLRNGVMRMSYLEKAIELAVDKHKGQLDKAGMPYILHPLFVMTKMDSEIEKIVAVLHDVVEDTDVTFEDLKAMGFSAEILAALDCVTKRDEEDYVQFIKRAKSNPIAAKVKLADLEHNMDLKRIKDVTDKDIERIVKRYKPAWDELKKL